MTENATTTHIAPPPWPIRSQIEFSMGCLIP
jgi:hypothetical protein